MIYSNIENILNTVSDAQAFAHPKDELSVLIFQYGNADKELSIDEMELVSAASAYTYQSFLDKIKELQNTI